MQAHIEKRIDRLRKTLARKKLDAFLVLIEENRRYLSGYTGEDTQFDESAGALLITADRLILTTDSRFDLQARREAPLYRVIRFREGLVKELPRLLKRLKAGRVGFESIRMTFSQYGKMSEAIEKAGLSVELVPTEDIVESQRIMKNRAEAAAVKKALEIAEAGFERVLESLRPGMTESEAAWLLESHLREGGAEGLSFPTIVAAGPNSALPHAVPGQRKIKDGVPILFDWGAKLGGYCSDISRTVVIGRPDATFRKVYQTVRDAQRKAIDAVRPGAGTKAVDAVAREFIAKKGFKGRFGHGLGHGVGLAIHEQPRLSPLSDRKIRTGMVFTVEPGIYLPRWGGVRIENMVRSKRGGAEVLNRLDTKLISIEV